MSELKVEEDSQPRLTTVDTTNSVHRSIFILGVCIICTFSIMMFMIIYGSFLLLTGDIVLKDVASASIVSGMIGSIVGYAAGYAQQVIGYYFGSSKSSSALSTALAGVVRDSSQKESRDNSKL